MEKSNLWKKGVVYQVYPRSFMDSNNDGIGDIQGIITKLDYLKDLGIDMIWLSPVYCSPNDDFGYDVSDYVNINPEYGTMEDMDQLIVEAMKKGIRIIMDLIINHTSDEHPWFKASKNPDSDFRDFYIWKDKPNNWTSFFTGSAWEKEGDQYYLHLFSKKQPDLNWNNPRVMEEIQNVMHYWLKKGIYGFRCDVINIIYKSSLNNGKKRIALVGREYYHAQEGCHEIIRKLNEEVLSQYDCFTVGETILVTTKEANDFILPKRKEFDMVFGFAIMETDHINNKWFKIKFNPNKWMRVVSKWQTEVYWNANYIENHDQPRSVSRFGDDKKYHKESAKMLATLNMTLKGTPYIYNGQEIGMTNQDLSSIEEYQDLETHNIYSLAKRLMFPKWLRMKMIKKTSRDNARQPMQWKKDGGFSSTKTWLKMNANMKEINVENQLNDEDSIYNHYKKLIQLRKKNEVLLYGDFKPLYMKRNIFIFRRCYENKTYITVSNMSKRKKRVPLELHGQIVLTNVGKIDLKSAVLLPYESILIYQENLNKFND